MVSVLVAAYNVERFINRGLSAILNQTYRELEIIVVDDGSTDLTFAHLKKYAEKDHRIKLIQHNINHGLGEARNTGLKYATGDYVCFIDLDDTPHSNMIETCVKQTEAHKCEMMIFGFNAIYDEKPNIIDPVSYNEHYITANTDLNNIYVNEILLARHGCGFAWNKFYRRSFIEKYNLRFGGQSIQQDEPFTLAALSKVERLFISKEILYDYYIYNSGNNRSRFIADRFNIYLDIDARIKTFLNERRILTSQAELFLLNRLWSGLKRSLDYDLTHPQCKWDKHEKKEVFKHIVSNPRAREIILSKSFSSDFRTKTYAKLMEKNRYRSYYSFLLLENHLKKLKKVL